MRLLFTCLPAFGHLQPMLPLAKACVAAGHEVLVGTGPDMVPRVEAFGLGAAPVGPTRAEGERIAQGGRPQADDEAPMRRVWDQYVFVHHFPTVGARLRAADLIPLARDFRADVVVHEVTDFAAPLAAAVVGAPSVLHSWGPPVAGKTMARAGAKASALWEEAGIEPPPAGGMYGGLYLSLAPTALWPTDAGDIAGIQQLRPDLPDESFPSLVADLDDLPHDRTVHLTLGTVANRSVGTFVTVLRAISDLPVNVIVTVGPDRDPSILGTWPAHVVVAPYLPIDQVLSRCDAVIDHGGSGTMLAALRHGLPQLMIPYDGDNVRNARLCEAAGVAVHLPLKEIDESLVRSGVSRILDDADLSAAAARVATEIAAMPAPAEVVGVLERYVAAKVPTGPVHGG